MDTSAEEARRRYRSRADREGADTATCGVGRKYFLDMQHVGDGPRSSIGLPVLQFVEPCGLQNVNKVALIVCYGGGSRGRANQIIANVSPGASDRLVA